MSDTSSRPCTAFQDATRIASGPLPVVALSVKAALAAAPAAAILVFDDATGKVVDLDLRGSDAEIAARHAPQGGETAGIAPDTDSADAPRGRGRPRLGVVAREVTLLPRHWDWLGQQPGGASQALRRLVDEARRNDGGRSRARAAQAAAYAFISAMAGDRLGFEEASRALFAGDGEGFALHSRSWPADIRAYAQMLIAGPAEPER
ncbi:conserved hypothetical protein [Hyphomicrobiales bacterium]|nr:conserved hypothetical protein [Hyphomicrobiales bacterium]CAH1700260.1 conserved hypothetical protein [Hyphomicrobiales bacterium]CAI0344038.1 DUF2239 family protein [Hyphomicrobiales bacterium]